ncbi:hypothetical protein JM946_08210 [Steroidobacter sp. S1-65]|uniref:Tellurite resistance TerB family protein n=1 Tax=Steroidobacter gossypii TaxID=2805490 RepID=A0ABS1WUS4_9GAMM|nr:hypothetical protein [Steroidobacter gossypii]MBM0104727.1 hypothetical protein [Steroidobacter gossypii]
MDERSVIAHSMVAMIMMAASDGELTRNEIDEMVLLLSIAAREQAPEAVLESLE